MKYLDEYLAKSGWVEIMQLLFWTSIFEILARTLAQDWCSWERSTIKAHLLDSLSFRYFCFLEKCLPQKRAFSQYQRKSIFSHAVNRFASNDLIWGWVLHLIWFDFYFTNEIYRWLIELAMQFHSNLSHNKISFILFPIEWWIYTYV